VTNYRQATRLDRRILHSFCRKMHRRGVYVAPVWHHSPYAAYMAGLVVEVIDAAVQAARAVSAAAAAWT
jgi:hypothetical protein